MSAVIWRQNRCYINEADYIGRVAEGSLELKRAMNEIGGLGQPAKMKVPNGHFELITAKIKFDNIAPADVRALSRNDGFIALRLIGQVHLPDAVSGKVAEDSLQTRLTGWAEEIPVPPMNQEHKTEIEITVNVAMVSITDKSGQLLLVDNVNGVVEPKELF